MHSANNSNTFLAYFNQIDKYLSYVLGLQRYVPYHERITTVIGKKTKVSGFVSGVEGKLRYFGDLRNHLVHGYRLDSKHYIHISEHAIEQIRYVHDELTKPKTIQQQAKAEVNLAQVQDSLDDVLVMMKEESLQYLPIYDGKIFMGILSFRDVIAWLVDQKIVELKALTIQDVDITYATEYQFISGDTSMYELQGVFADKEATEVILATATGEHHEEILAMISAHDLAHFHATNKAPIQK